MPGPGDRAEIRDAFAQAAQDDGVRVILLTAARGGTFCVGADVTGIAGRRPDRPALIACIISTGRRGGEPPVEDLARRYSYILNNRQAGDRANQRRGGGRRAGGGRPYCDLRFMAAGASSPAPSRRRGLITSEPASPGPQRLVAR